MEQTVQEISVKRPWQELITQGMHYRILKDRSQWELGDLAGEIEKDYGVDAIGEFAREIGIQKKTLYEYRRIAKAYNKVHRMELLSFHHHQIALGTKDPADWLEKAHDNNWSCEQMFKEIQKTSSEKAQADKPKVLLCDTCGKWYLDTDEVCKERYLKPYTMPPVQGDSKGV